MLDIKLIRFVNKKQKKKEEKSAIELSHVHMESCKRRTHSIYHEDEFMMIQRRQHQCHDKNIYIYRTVRCVLTKR